MGEDIGQTNKQTDMQSDNKGRLELSGARKQITEHVSAIIF